MNFLKLWLLGLVSESLDDIIALFDKLDTRLDRYIDTQRTRQTYNRAKIEALQAENESLGEGLSKAIRTQSNIRSLIG